jgi:hypothetical protein
MLHQGITLFLTKGWARSVINVYRSRRLASASAGGNGRQYLNRLRDTHDLQPTTAKG